MLVDVPGVKPDRMILRFVGEAAGSPVSRESCRAGNRSRCRAGGSILGCSTTKSGRYKAASARRPAPCVPGCIKGCHRIETRLRLADTPHEVHPLVACRGFTACMPHPRWKGPREPVQLKLPKHEKDVLAERASFAGLSYSEYVMALLRQEPLDKTGHPTWVQDVGDQGGALQLAM